MSVDASIPRFVNLPELRANPLAFLRAAHVAGNALIVISETGPVFSRARDCSATVAVFGPTGVRQVLNDADIFGTVVSVGELLSLPHTLKRLNSGLFNMRGEQHRHHQQILRSLLTADRDGRRASFGGEVRERFGAARVGHENLMSQRGETTG